ncbi:recombinase family protein [Streptomyces albireticuli]|uniref:Integrase n=1 Tax=Streptomyces albireticuli TaxID=1940 RepID=A0A2A2D5X1_9ACTN|nr:recombinase family protein [Streptomyces albireticuli]MCD9196216.1 recombinase family protein [Streptomyces albireticuli]PAU46712.1 integrase [Streptomyces albireticuli]
MSATALANRPTGNPSPSDTPVTTTALLRGVRAVRLSVLTDETTSPERQREATDIAALAQGIDLADREAVDLGVSASKTTPFERPELGAWLRRPDEFDALVFWRFDRAVRSMDDMHELAKWARDHRKVIVFAEGPGGRLVLDFRNPLDPMSSLMVTLFAFAAQMEAQAIKERVLGAQAAMRVMPLRWRGSRPPYGYMPVELEGGGWTLVPDPDAVAVIERMIRDLMAGMTASLLAAELNAEGVLSPRDYWAVKQGRKTGGKTGGAKGQRGKEAVQRERFKWTPNVIRKVLTSLAMLGQKLHNGKPVRDADGNPVMATNSPIMERAEYDAVCALFEERAQTPSKERKDTNALLLGVIHCDHCGGRMYLSVQDGRQPTYKCNSHGRGDLCEAPANVRGDWVDDYVEREFLALLGSLHVTRTIETPGYDPAPEIAEVTAEIAEHMPTRKFFTAKSAVAAWEDRTVALNARLNALEATPKREAQREVIRTGKTYADLWAESDTAARRRMLTSAGAILTVKRGTRGGWRSLDTRRIGFGVHELDHMEAAERLEEIRAEETYAEAA